MNPVPRASLRGKKDAYVANQLRLSGLRTAAIDDRHTQRDPGAQEEHRRSMRIHAQGQSTQAPTSHAEGRDTAARRCGKARETTHCVSFTLSRVAKRPTCRATSRGCGSTGLCAPAKGTANTTNRTYSTRALNRWSSCELSSSVWAKSSSRRMLVSKKGNPFAIHPTRSWNPTNRDFCRSIIAKRIGSCLFESAFTDNNTTGRLYLLQ